MIKDFMDAPHKIGRMCGFSDLRPIHSRWIKRCWYGPPRAYALQAARGSYKSSSCLILGAALNLIARPDRHCCIITKTEAGSMAVLRSIQRLLEGECLRALWKESNPTAALAFTESTQSRLSIAAKRSPAPEPNIAAFSAGGSITRQHFDDIIVDDVITLEDRVSAAARRRTLDFLMELFSNIAKSGARIICSGTPWHKDDAWSFISEVCGGVDKYPMGAPGMEFMDTPEVAERRARLTPSLDAINYKLELAKDESLIFSEPKRGEPEKGWRPIIHVDAAYGGGDSTAITITDGVCLRGLLREGHVDNYIKMINDVAHSSGARWGYCEDNGDKGYLRKALEEDGVERGRSVRWRGYHETRNKGVKIQTVLYPKWRSLYITPDTDPEYLEQILYWSADGNGRDDAPDSAASAMIRLERVKSKGAMPNIGGVQ
ncbi:MAG: hypothetical protein LBL45_10190 [Treponema sp.]|jgi:hypothetical protein|nr:hypothetical protein [Treponema sp.]